MKMIIAKAGNLSLEYIEGTKRDVSFVMRGGHYGEHSLFEPCYNARVASHWSGYCANNGEKPPFPNLDKLHAKLQGRL